MHQVIIDPGVFHQAAASQLFAGFADLLAPLLHAGGIRSAHEAVARADENSRSPKLRCVSRKPGHEADYIERTVSKVMGLPSVQLARAELARAPAPRQRGMDRGGPDFSM